jgi:hypothetical protein
VINFLRFESHLSFLEALDTLEKTLPSHDCKSAA